MLRLVAVPVLLLLAAGAVTFALLRDESEEPAPADSLSDRSTTGLLLQVDPQQLVVKPAGGGAPQTFVVRPAERPMLDLDHLREHLDQRLPVTVEWASSGGGPPYATRVLDA